MANEYKIRLEVRCRSSAFGADTVTELLLQFATELFRLDQATSPQSIQDNIEATAKELVEKYHQLYIKSNNRGHSPIAGAGLEIEVAKCYLQGRTINETVSWLRKEKEFKTSMTAIGRYWSKFAQANSEEKAL
jgi:hypothetical protein